MAYDLQTTGDAFTLTLSGSVDLSETSNVKDILKNEPKAGFKRLVIECGDTEYMDSSAVALLLFAKRVAEESQMVFEIASISSSAKKIIEMAGLGAVFALPKVSNPEATTEDNVEVAGDIKLEEEIAPADGGMEMDLADKNDTDEIELNLPEAEAEANLDFSDDTPKEDDFTMDFDEETIEPDKSQVVDNKQKSGENSPRGDDSGDSKSDDFEFKPGTFE